MAKLYLWCDWQEPPLATFDMDTGTDADAARFCHNADLMDVAVNPATGLNEAVFINLSARALRKLAWEWLDTVDRVGHQWGDGPCPCQWKSTWVTHGLPIGHPDRWLPLVRVVS